MSEDEKIQVAQVIVKQCERNVVWSLSEFWLGGVHQRKRPMPLKMNSEADVEAGYEPARLDTRCQRYSPDWQMELLTKWRKIRAEWEAKHGGNSETE